MKYKGISILKRPHCNTWYARYRNNGKQFYVSARTQQECYNKLKLALKNKTKEALIENESLTLNEWYNKWLATYKTNLKQTTLLDYKGSLKYIPNLLSQDITKLTNLEIIQELNNIPFIRRKQKVYDLLNDMFNKAVKNHIILINPITDDKPKHKKINGISLSIEDQNNFKNICSNRTLMFLVCLYQGLRKGEMLALTKNDFDLENKTLTINKALNMLNQLDDTKNTYSNRVIPLFDRTIEVIKPIIQNLKENERLFNISQQTCDKLFRKLKTENNLNEKYTIHSLRHTFITNCQEKNIPLHIIQKWVGHNIGSKVTSSVYTHIRDEAEAKYYNIYNI